MKLQRAGNVTVITLSGKIDTETARDLKQDLYDYCDSNPGHTLLDMSGVGFVSSYLIGILVACHKMLKGAGRELHLAGLDTRLRTVLDVAGLTEVFPRHETREAGVAHFNRSQASA